MREDRAQVAQEQLRARLFRRRVEARDLDGARDAQPVLHRRDEDLAIRRRENPPDLHAGIRQHHVVAALRFQRHPDAQRREQPRGPGAGGEHDLVRRQVARIGDDAGRATAIEADGAHFRLPDLAAHAADAGRDHLGHAGGVHAGSVVGQEDGAGIGGRDLGFECRKAGAVQHLHAQPVAAAQFQGSGVLRHLRIVPVEVHLTLLPDQVRRPLGEQDLPVPFGRAEQQRGQRSGRPFHLRRAGGGDEAQQPGRGLEPVAERNVQRPGAVGEHLRHLPQHARHGERRDRPVADRPRIAGIGRMRLACFQHQRREAAPCQVPGHAEPHDSAADDDDPRPVRCAVHGRHAAPAPGRAEAHPR